MADDVILGDVVSSDLAALGSLYRAAFPNEDLIPLVEKIEACTDAVSFAADLNGAIIGHIAFTLCGFENYGGVFALLSPLAVHPDHSRRGIGARLIQKGRAAMEARDVSAILVLGDPAYYGRFGFNPERTVLPPYPLPKEWTEAWGAIWLNDDRPGEPGTLIVPEPWRDPALWR